MSTITYKCNVCKREIDKLENMAGMTVFAKCIITEGCRGNLYKTYRDASNIRESFPPAKTGLIDYTPRKLLYVHDQIVPTTEWRIFHDLSCSPSIVVYETTDMGMVQLDQDTYTVSVVDKDSVSIVFTTPKKGIAHCLARSTVPTQPKLITPISSPIRATANSMLVIAVPEVITTTDNPDWLVPFNTADHTIRIKIETTRPNEEPVICFEEFTDSINSTAWLGWHRVLIRNRRHYNLFGKNVNNFRTFSDIDGESNYIPDGTVVRFLGIDYGDSVPPNDFREIPNRGLLFLLSQEPFAAVDKIRDRLIGVDEMIDTEYDYFVFTDGELYTNETNVESTYPEIKNAPGRTSLNVIPPTPQITIPYPSASPVASPLPTPTPTATVTATVTPTISITPTMTITPTLTPTITPTISVTASLGVTPTVTPNPTITPTSTVTPTVTPSMFSTLTPTPTQTVTPNPTGTPVITPTVTVNPTITPTQSVTPTITPTHTSTPTVTPTQTITPTVSGVWSFTDEFSPEFK